MCKFSMAGQIIVIKERLYLNKPYSPIAPVKERTMSDNIGQGWNCGLVKQAMNLDLEDQSYMYEDESSLSFFPP